MVKTADCIAAEHIARALARERMGTMANESQWKCEYCGAPACDCPVVLYRAVVDAANAAVDKLTEWLAYKSDNGYFDDRECDLSWEAERLLDDLSAKLGALAVKREG